MSTLYDQLKQFLLGSRGVVVVGVGNQLRGDDGVGVLVAELLRGKKIPNTTVLPTTTPENIVGTIRRFNPSHVIVVDSVLLGEPPGTIKVVEKGEIGGFTVSTHGMSLGLFMDYLEVSIGCKTMLIGVQPKKLGFGDEMSKEVRIAAEKLVETLVDVLAGD